MTQSHCLPLTSKTSIVPIQHGKAPYCLEVRKLLWEQSFDCVALAFPACLQPALTECVENLPIIHSLVIKMQGDIVAYAPADPSDGFIEGTRQALQRHLPLRFLEDNTLLYYQHHLSLPDSYLIKNIGISEYLKICLQYLKQEKDDDTLRHRALINLKEIKELESEYRRILWLCDFPLMSVISSLPGPLNNKISALGARANELESMAPDEDIVEVETFPVKSDHVYFALGELPFYAGELEKGRMDPMVQIPDYLELIKKIFLETRKNYLKSKEDIQQVSITRLQVALKYLRNMAALNGRLTPDLFEIINAAKGVFGHHFARKVLEAAKYYPFFDFNSSEEEMKIGINHISTPTHPEPAEAVNLLQDEPKTWHTIHIKKLPDKDKQKQYRYLWDPRGMCSHVPEDKRIEGFNQTLRKKSHKIMVESLAKSEKFTSSIKDGIDIRETLRNWHTGDVYIKETPPFNKNVDTVVIIFDHKHDDKYPHRATWYAEHKQESTLTFFATDPFANLIGPGIAEAEYGGVSLLFPPRFIPDVFSSFPSSRFADATEQLVFGAVIHSRERHITYVSYQKPTLRLRLMAKKFKRSLIWVPLSSFSNETLRRLRYFHILNSKHVRSWASHFIAE